MLTTHYFRILDNWLKDLDTTTLMYPADSEQGVEKDEHYKLTLALPGYDPENIELSIVDRYLKVTASPSKVHLPGAEHQLSRKYLVPDKYDLSKIEADTQFGLLTISIPKKASEIPRKVKVKNH